jgi:hypothetical protein
VTHSTTAELRLAIAAVRAANNRSRDDALSAVDLLSMALAVARGTTLAAAPRGAARRTLRADAKRSRESCPFMQKVRKTV